MKFLIKPILFWAITLLAQTNVSAQECGTTPTPQQIEYLTQTRNARQAFDMGQIPADRFGTSIYWIPVQFQECLPSSNSLRGLSEQSISTWMGELNAIFLPYKIQFYECGSYSVFVNSTLHFFDYTEEPQLAAYDIPNVINIYAFGTVTINGSSVAG